MNLWKNSKLRRRIIGRIKGYQFGKEVRGGAGSPRIFLFGIPLHVNLGDHAIAMAERYFFQRYFKKRTVHEIPVLYINGMIPVVKKNITSEDLIVITGGGFLGNVWMSEYRMIEKVVKEFTGHKIVIFPQSVYFTQDEEGKKAREKSMELFSKHKQLYLCAREKISYEYMRLTYQKNRILLCPDMVLFGGFTKHHEARNGILLCLREDEEMSLDSQSRQRIREELEELGGEVRTTDTVIIKHVGQGEREIYVNEKIKEFSKAELVVTDRLHGMIFCALAGTPCIALGNSNHKIRGVYDWIKSIESIVYMDVPQEIKETAEELLMSQGQQKQPYHPELIRDRFLPLVELINKEFRKKNGQRMAELK